MRINLPLAPVNSKSFFRTQLKPHFLRENIPDAFLHHITVSFLSLRLSWNVHFLQSSYFSLWVYIYSCNFFLLFNLTYSKIDLYLAYSSMNFNLWIDSCNHHHNQETQQFHHPSKTPSYYPFAFKLSPSLIPGNPTDVLCHRSFVFPECHTNGIICCMFGFMQHMPLIFNHVVACINRSFLFIDKQYFTVRLYNSLSIFLLKDIGLFPALGHYE